MKKVIFILVLSLMFLSACSKEEQPIVDETLNNDNAIEETVVEDNKTEKEESNEKSEIVEEVDEDNSLDAEEETTSVEEMEENNTELEETVTNLTANGFTIEEKDGCTYVDGLLIANKTYTLPEDYNPGGLVDYVEEAFETMQDAASAEGLDIFIVSGFRSYEYQKGLYQRYCNRDGQAAADTYSARAGHSEHQTGLCMDINEISNSFGETAEGKWVAEHAHEYGFIIRYPKGKDDITGYCYEPWHIRYLGVETATKVYESGLCLEEYLGITSEYKD